MKQLIILLMLTGVFAGEGETPPSRRNVSVGILDDKTGLSLVGYTYNLKQTETDEWYIGGGTILAAITASAGWKHSYSVSGFSFYHTAGIQAITAMGGDKIMGSVSLGYEKRFGEKWSVRLGGLAFLILDQYDSIMPLPFININYRF